MTHEQIGILLDKYWEGETTLEEERALKSYFAAGKVADQFLPVAPMFEALRSEQSVQFSKPRVAALPSRRMNWPNWSVAAAVAALLIAGGWWFLRQGNPAQNIVEQPYSTPAPTDQPGLAPKTEAPLANIQSEVPEISKINVKPLRKGLKPRTKTKTPETFEDPEQALEEIKAALVLVSSKLNKGKKEAAKNLNKIETVDKIFKRKKESQG